jgi:hypothetical protein
MQSVENPWSVHVDMARDDRRAELARGWPTRVPARRETTRWNIQGPVGAQPELHQGGVHSDLQA